jgi:hypothetical protein
LRQKPALNCSGHQNLVDDMDHAVRLENVGDRDAGAASVLKCLQAGIAAAEPPGQSIMPIAA